MSVRDIDNIFFLRRVTGRSWDAVLFAYNQSDKQLLTALHILLR